MTGKLCHRGFILCACGLSCSLPINCSAVRAPEMGSATPPPVTKRSYSADSRSLSLSVFVKVLSVYHKTRFSFLTLKDYSTKRKHLVSIFDTKKLFNQTVYQAARKSGNVAVSKEWEGISSLKEFSRWCRNETRDRLAKATFTWAKTGTKVLMKLYALGKKIYIYIKVFLLVVK